MKTLKFSTLLIALASVFTFSSCLDENEGTSWPAYSQYVTIAGDATFGYTFYSDLGCTLRPTAASVKEVLPDLGKSKAKRAVIAFDMLNEAEQGQDLQPGRTYDIVLGVSPYANYAIPTYHTMDITDNSVAADSLINKNQPINNVDNRIWGINGYVNAQLTINYDPNKPFYLNTYYNREQDIDTESNTLYLTLYYNHNSTFPSNQGAGLFSFDLPDDVAYEFNTDSVNIVLKALNNSKEMEEVGKCRIAVNDFHAPVY